MSFQSIAVVPAAGRSRRMGGEKLLLPWRDRTVIEQTLGAWRASAVEHIVVVVHPADDRLAEVCTRLAADIAVVAADAPPPEMKDSILLGLAEARRRFQPGPRDVWLMAPADLPTLSPAVIDQLLAAHQPDRPAILLPVFEGRTGHPALFPWPLSDAVAALPEGAGVNRLFQTHSPRQIESIAAAIPPDLDTPDDYARLTGYHSA
jgi:molybdenum cofactor cytidylyltransferase